MLNMPHRWLALSIRYTAVFGLAISPALVVAQTNVGSIDGTVRDAGGRPTAGVEVYAFSQALVEKQRAAVTHAEGRYRLVALSVGTYTLKFTHRASWDPSRETNTVCSATREAVIVRAGVTTVVDVVLDTCREEKVVVTGH